MVNKDKKIAEKIFCSYNENLTFPFGYADCTFSLRVAKKIFSRIYAKGIDMRIEFLDFLNTGSGHFFKDDAKKYSWMKRQYLHLCRETKNLSLVNSLKMLHIKMNLQKAGVV